jgi:hypothetical protein
MYITITQEHESRLTRHIWTFWVAEHRDTIRVLLDRYALEDRPTARHKYTSIPDNRYSRLGRNFGPDACNRRVSMVHIPEDVAEQARAAVVATITVSKEAP